MWVTSTLGPQHICPFYGSSFHFTEQWREAQSETPLRGVIISVRHMTKEDSSVLQTWKLEERLSNSSNQAAGLGNSMTLFTISQRKTYALSARQVQLKRRGKYTAVGGAGQLRSYSGINEQKTSPTVAFWNAPATLFTSTRWFEARARYKPSSLEVIVHLAGKLVTLESATIALVAVV